MSEKEWEMLIKLAWNTMSEDEFYDTFGADAEAFVETLKAKQKSESKNDKPIEDVPY